jgi:DNA-3-methyladenine glycosylase
VEVEAYVGEEDRASHARFGETLRNRVMFGPPGRAYVYLVYGMYDCLNVVTEPDGVPAAVLIRAVAPTEGVERMRVDRVIASARRRRARTPAQVAEAAERIAGLPADRIASGPGLVGASFGIDTRWTGLDLCDPASALRLEERPVSEAPPVVRSTPRIGIAFAGPPWVRRPWRFVEVGHPSASGPGSRR